MLSAAAVTSAEKGFSMTYTLGFIGTGNMGSALARAAAKSEGKSRIFLSDHSGEKAAALAKTLSAALLSNEAIAEGCKFVILGVKPQMLKGVLESLSAPLSERPDTPILVSMAAGVTIAQIREYAGRDYPVIRIMPNTPVSVGEGLILTAASENVTTELLSAFKACFSAAGRFDDVPEALFDAAGSLSGCGPAFAAMFMEALADGAVLCGVPRIKALTHAAQMLLGTAKLYLESGEHPGAMKDAVCSPGGSTIAGVRALEEHGFRAAAISAVEASCKRTKELGKN